MPSSSPAGTTPSTTKLSEKILFGRALATVLGSSLLLGLAACSAEVPDANAFAGSGQSVRADDESEAEGDTGDIWNDDQPAGPQTIARGRSSGCAASRSAITSSVSGARKAIIQRAFGWLDDKVPYSQSRMHEGFRTDCSGFVSMAWDLSKSFTTAAFANGTAENHKLSGFGSLQPGDALVRRTGGSGHIVLFLGWDDEDQSSACVIEQASTALDMQFHPRSASSLRSGGYKPVRADSLD